MSSKEFYFKDNNKTAHWVGHAKLKPLDKGNFSKEKVIDESQDILTSTTIEQSDPVKKNNPDLLQKSEEQ